MTALFIPCSFRKKSAFSGIFLSLMLWVHPGALVLANSEESLGQNQPIVFEVKNPTSNLQATNSGLQLEEIAKNDPLVNNLKLYLEKHRSPLAVYSKDIVLQPQWQRALAISWVESNFGRFCHSDNCSGIGGAPGMKSWRKYPNKLEWFKDMAQLLEKPIYKEKYTTFQKMKGIYVQPGTINWVRGAQKKYDELTKLTDESIDQRQLISQKQAEKLALVTFPSITETE